MINAKNEEHEEYKQFSLVLLLLFFVYIFIMPRTGHVSDSNFWATWAVYISENGLGNIYYKEGANYPPFYMHILKLYSVIQGSAEKIYANIYTLKIISLLFDFASAFITTLLITDRRKKFFYPLLLLLNIAFLYNTLIWNQVDTIFTTFMFSSLYFFSKEKITPAVVFYLLALNAKVQAIIFFPIFLLLLLPLLYRSNIRKIIQLFLAISITELLLLAPFIYEGTTGMVFQTMFGAVDYYPLVSVGAINIWEFFITRSELGSTSDQAFVFGSISYKALGLMFFFISSAIILIPLALESLRRIRERSGQVNPELLFLTAGLIPLVFFYFNTQMHERYCHPALLMLGMYAFLSGRFSLYIILSIAYLLNLERVLEYLKFSNYGTALFHPVLISIEYLITILLGIYYLYKYFGNTLINSTLTSFRK